MATRHRGRKCSGWTLSCGSISPKTIDDCSTACNCLFASVGGGRSAANTHGFVGDEMEHVSISQHEEDERMKTLPLATLVWLAVCGLFGWQLLLSRADGRLLTVSEMRDIAKGAVS